MSRYGGDEQNYAWMNFYLEESRAANAGSKGKLVEAEARFRNALAIADESLPWTEWLGYTNLALAKNLIRQGRLLEAEIIVRKVLGRRQWLARISPLIPAAMLRFSEVLYEQGRFGDAEAAARITIKAFDFICTAPENIQFTTAVRLTERCWL